MILQVVDVRWREHLENMDYLREGVHLRAMAQKDPLVEYTSEGHVMFEELNAAIREEVVQTLYHAEIEVEEVGELQQAQAAQALDGGGFAYEHDQLAGAQAIAAAGAGSLLGDGASVTAGGSAQAAARSQRSSVSRATARRTSAATIRAGAAAARSSSAATARSQAVPSETGPAQAPRFAQTGVRPRVRSEVATSARNSLHATRFLAACGRSVHASVRGRRTRPAGENRAGSYHRPAMADQITSVPLDQQLQEIGAQLAWVRDYL